MSKCEYKRTNNIKNTSDIDKVLSDTIWILEVINIARRLTQK